MISAVPRIHWLASLPMMTEWCDAMLTVRGIWAIFAVKVKKEEIVDNKENSLHSIQALFVLTLAIQTKAKPT